MSNPYLRTEHLSVGYHGRALMEDIGLALSKGEIVTLIGPNGAGKSTILKSIAKQLKLIAGQVFLEDAELKSISEKELAGKAAIVFTEHLSPELMSVWEVAALGRYPYTDGLGQLKAADREIVHRVMEQTGIAELGNLQFAQLSDGQKQRVLLARAICQEPDILILDEPTSYLDVHYKLEFFSILQSMTRKKQIGVLMSLHELDLAERISDKIVCVDGTRIRFYGTPEEVFRDGLLKQLYGISEGSFDEKSGGIELKKNVGKSEVFVIAGNASGCFLYRRLQREGIPFSTGILAENDLDYPIALALANRLIGVKAYEPIAEQDFQRAREELLACKRVISCLRQFGTYNAGNAELIRAAEAVGIDVEYIT